MKNLSIIQTRIVGLVIPLPVIPPMTADDNRKNASIHNAHAFRGKAINCLAALSFEAAGRNIEQAEHFAKLAGERKVTAEMKKHGWQPAPDGRIYVGHRLMTVSAGREIVRQHKAAQKYADAFNDGSNEPW